VLEPTVRPHYGQPGVNWPKPFTKRPLVTVRAAARDGTRWVPALPSLLATNNDDDHKSLKIRGLTIVAFSGSSRRQSQCVFP
jgi:hypothetical protein